MLRSYCYRINLKISRKDIRNLQSSTPPNQLSHCDPPCAYTLYLPGTLAPLFLVLVCINGKPPAAFRSARFRASVLPLGRPRRLGAGFAAAAARGAGMTTEGEPGGLLVPVFLAVFLHTSVKSITTTSDEDSWFSSFSSWSSSFCEGVLPKSATECMKPPSSSFSSWSSSLDEGGVSPRSITSDEDS